MGRGFQEVVIKPVYQFIDGLLISPALSEKTRHVSSRVLTRKATQRGHSANEFQD